MNLLKPGLHWKTWDTTCHTRAQGLACRRHRGHLSWDREPGGPSAPTVTLVTLGKSVSTSFSICPAPVAIPM